MSPVWHAVRMTPDLPVPPVADDAHRGIELTKIGEGRYKATNARGGVVAVGSGGDPDFTPVELLLAAIAGCSAIDVDLITGKRAQATGFDVVAEGDKVRDEGGNHLTGLRVTFEIPARARGAVHPARGDRNAA